MKRILTVGALIVVMGAGIALADYHAPSAQQLAQAAATPASVAALIAGASAEQAADVVRAVIAQVLGLNLGDEAQATRITQVVAAAMGGLEGPQLQAFATALGQAVGGSAVLRGNLAVVSTIQAAVVTAAGSSGTAIGAAFGDAYNSAIRQSGTARNDSSKPDMPAPATGYPIQMAH